MEDQFVSRCERVIREEAQSPLSDGRATLRRVESEIGDWLELVPASERACPLSVTPNGPGDGELSIGLGRNESRFEVWGSANETVEFLRKALDAVIAGRYEEFVKGRKASAGSNCEMGRISFGTTRCSRVGLRSSEAGRA
jgi:hypothetical protein